MTYVKYDPEATCVSCRCTDTRACNPPCSWVRVDYNAGIGVCSTPDCNTPANIKMYELQVQQYQRKNKK